MKLLVTALLLFCPIALFGLGENWKGKTVVAEGKVWLRTSSPTGLFCSKAQQIDDIKPGERLLVLEYVKIRCSLFLTYDFLRVERLNSSVPLDKRTGYVAVIDANTGRPLFKEAVREAAK